MKKVRCGAEEEEEEGRGCLDEFWMSTWSREEKGMFGLG